MQTPDGSRGLMSFNSTEEHKEGTKKRQDGRFRFLLLLLASLANPDKQLHINRSFSCQGNLTTCAQVGETQKRRKDCSVGQK